MEKVNNCIKDMAIKFLKDKDLFVIEDDKTQYMVEFYNNELLRNLYWENQISDISDFYLREIKELSSNNTIIDMMREEYSVFGGMRYKENVIVKPN